MTRRTLQIHENHRFCETKPIWPVRRRSIRLYIRQSFSAKTIGQAQSDQRQATDGEQFSPRNGVTQSPCSPEDLEHDNSLSLFRLFTRFAPAAKCCWFSWNESTNSNQVAIVVLNITIRQAVAMSFSNKSQVASVILRTSEETFLIVTNEVDRQNFCDNDPKKAYTVTLNARLRTNDESS